MTSSHQRAAGLEGLLSALLLAVLGGMIGTSNLGLPITARGTEKKDARASVPEVGRVEALAWEDPLAAAASAMGIGDRGRTLGETGPEYGMDQLPDPATATSGITETVEPVRVLACVMPSERTPEAEEDRRQKRYAMHAAMSDLGFAALSSGSVRFARMPPSELSDASRVGLHGVLAHEWFKKNEMEGERSRLQRVLVLYLTMGSLSASRPMVDFSSLVERVVGNSPREFTDRRNPGVGKATVLTASTGDLLSFLRDMARRDFCSRANFSARLNVLDTGSTADLQDVGLVKRSSDVIEHDTDGVLHEWALRELQKLRERSPKSYPAQLVANAEDLIVPSLSQRRIANGLQVERLLQSDRLIARQMADELRLRGVDVGDPKNTVVCLFERANAYAVAFAESVREACRSSSGGAGSEGVNYETIAYERVIDGASLATTRDDPTLMRVEATPDGVRAFGKPQLDASYRALRDLARAADLTKPKLRAVVIVGSDTFDKRTLIHLVRREFPEVLVLTPDMQAIFEDPADYHLMRNVIVVSHAGLTPPAIEWKGELANVKRASPPRFRSMYQTSLYLGVLRTFGVNTPPLGEPIVYEIGRRGGIVLTDQAKGLWTRLRDRVRGAATSWWTAWGLGFAAFVVVNLWLGPERRKLSVARRWMWWIAIATTLGVACIGLAGPGAIPLVAGSLMALTGGAALLALGVWVYSRGSRAGADPEREWAEIHDHGFNFVYGSVLLLLSFLLIVLLGSGPAGEPFAFWNGISAWPSEGIRMIVIVLGAVFLARIVGTFRSEDRQPPDSLCRGERGWLAKFIQIRGIVGWEAPKLANSATEELTPEVSRAVGPKAAAKDAAGRVDTGGRAEREAKIDAGCLEREFWFKARGTSMGTRIAITSLLFGLMAVGCFLIDRPPLTPHRGGFSRAVYWVTFVGSGVLLNLVIFGVWDLARLLDRYISNLSRGASDWGDERLDREALRTGVPPEFVGSLTDVEMIAEKTERFAKLIYFPVILILLSALAWHPGFDNWRWSWQLIVIFGVNIVVAAVAAQTLRRSAELARSAEIKRLDAHLLADLHGRDQSPGVLPEALIVEFGPASSRNYIENFRAFVEGGRECHVSSRDAVAVAAAVAASGGGVGHPAESSLASRRIKFELRDGGRSFDGIIDGRVASPAELAATAQAIDAAVKAHRFGPSPEQQVKLIERLKLRIQEVKTGAFAPWTENPVIRSVVLPAIGYGTVKIAELIQQFAR